MVKSTLRILALALLAGCGGGGSSSDDGGGTSGGGGGGGGGGGTTITPDNPGAADVQITSNTSQTKPISRFIYGKNSHNWTNPANLTLGRAGGNRWTAYNWENNASNAGTDWYNQNDGYLGGGNTPAEAVRPQIQTAHANDAAMLITVPICGYVAADKSPGGDVNQSADYLNTRFRVSVAKKGSAFVYPPNASDAYVYQDEFVWRIDQLFPYAKTHATQTIFYSLDNEPDLWSETHPRIHPNPVGYDELRQRTIAFANAIKDVVPEAVVFGSVNYGWHGMTTLQDAPDGGGQDFLNYFLAAMKTAEQTYGKRLVDVLDIHWYPEATGDGVRITTDSSTGNIAAARIQAPRSLWDPTYTETSWIAQYSTNGPIQLLPRIQQKIDTHYPGTKMAVTEYYYGGGADISGGIAQADALGIFGREGVFAATLWHLGSTDDRFIHGAFSMFRNFDGANGSFGDVSAATTCSNTATYSAYSSVDAQGRVILVLINKSSSPRTAGIAVTHTQLLTTAEVYTITSANYVPQKQADLGLTMTNALVYTMPGMSVTTLVLKP